ncbi:regulatory protein RecX [Xanthomarina sp. F1114]|uniref:regulatory protein RecX n=1 Tax=Xanthomarina sp. F1114 TaxID=2996019 RepID=UPI00225DE1E9|nr:regulatory protein RecX [Xanthomarina sp. F1114]MCX7546433.1 regulatory protein RecX [Xanthomarina sp. F1114]
MKSVKTYTLEEAKRNLENYCAYQERCHKEVTQKLYKMRMIPEAIDLVVVHLLEHDFLNETRFAKTYARGKFRVKKWGKKRLEIELKKRDISAYNIKEAFKEIPDSDYLNVFHELAEKKAATIKETNPFKKKKKLADYLLYRGWESHLVYDKVNELF